MLEFLKLELRKQRLILQVLGGIFLATVLILGPLIACFDGATNFGGATWRAGASMMSFAWLVGALPFLPLVFGAATGAGLRAEPAASAEAVLPLSPARKALAALIAATLGFLAILGLIFTAFAIFAPYLPSVTGARPVAGDAVPVLIVLAGALILLVSAFAFAYAFKHGLLGMLLAVALGVATFGGVIAGIAAREILRHDGVKVEWLWITLVPLLALAGPLLALPRLARFAERRELPGVPGWLLISAGLAAGAGAASLWCGTAFGGVVKYRQPFVANCEGLVDASCAAAARHQLSISRTGELFGASNGRVASLLPPSGRNPVELLQHPWFYPVQSAVWDADGTLWVLTLPEPEFEYNVRTGRDYELWHGDGDSPLKRYGFFRLPKEIERVGFYSCGNTLFLANLSGRYAPFPEPGKSPVFSEGIPGACRSPRAEAPPAPAGRR